MEETYRRRDIAAFLTEHMLNNCSEENLTDSGTAWNLIPPPAWQQKNAVSIYSRSALIIGLKYRNLYME